MGFSETAATGDIPEIIGNDGQAAEFYRDRLTRRLLAGGNL
jgi:hypothetical protein